MGNKEGGLWTLLSTAVSWTLALSGTLETYVGRDEGTPILCLAKGLEVSNSTEGKQQQRRNTVFRTWLQQHHLSTDSHGHMEPDMVPFWHLGGLAASFVMLNESNENTMYNLAQVSKIKQLKSEDDQLNFEYEILLHEIVSQEIIRWKLLITWSPEKSLKVLESELLPRCRCN
ncbi:Latexin [Bagarius yarrelli]|uniref:Latexin n=1 Tax=Bagarius yarrelli TaxID=175774 RepID=A0A556UY98_BAGYA|nr:Latexin [Bagarius yarrelli]